MSLIKSLPCMACAGFARQLYSQWRRKLFKSGGGISSTFVRKRDSTKYLDKFPQKVGGGKAPLAPPLPTPGTEA